MIISASRRTDIPAFFAGEFMAAVRAGFIDVPHPRDPRKVSRISLKPEDVDLIVFWTRNPKPLLTHLPELDARGFVYYFQFTILDHPRILDPGCPPADEVVAVFRELAAAIGPDKVVWRYDPIVLSELTNSAYHQRKFENLAAALSGATKRVMISLVDCYRSVVPRLRGLERQGIHVRPPGRAELAELIPALVAEASARKMDIFSCAEEFDLRPWGVGPGKCIDDDLIADFLGRRLPLRKDPRQRKACGCVESRDIGIYGTCLHGCIYCYAG
jgi:hypothetical protein